MTSDHDLSRLAAVEAHLDDMRKYVGDLESALRAIACFDDTMANRILRETGSYDMFDEPYAVEIARKALGEA
jgi:hypothetical protein